MPTIKDLFTPQDGDYWLSRLLAIAQTKRLPISDYNDGGVLRTLLETDAAVLADLALQIPTVAKMSFLDTAEGDVLTIKARDAFSTERYESKFATGKVTLTCDAQSGPYNISSGQLWLGTVNGKRYNNTSGGTLVAGSTLTINVRAESPGAGWNTPGNTITVMHTPLPGITVSNSFNWLTSEGADAESDERLRLRCKLRWAELGNATSAAYKSWALRSHPNITRVQVLDQHPRGQGTVNVIVFGASNLSAEAMAAATAAIDEKKPNIADVLVQSATVKTVNINGTVTTRPGYSTVAQADGLTRITQLQANYPIGGEKGTFYRSALIEALFVPNVINVQLTSPADTIAVANNEVVVFTIALTYQEG